MGGVAGGLALHACTQAPEATTEAGETAAAPGGMSATIGSTLWIGYVHPLYRLMGA